MSVYERRTADGTAGVVTGSFGGRPAFSVPTDPQPGGTGPRAEIVQLDSRTLLPQVVFLDLLAELIVASRPGLKRPDSAGNWRTVSGDTLDGDGYEFIDIVGDGTKELVSVDNAFLYAFAAYASSYAPPKIQQLDGLELRDVTREPKYQNYLRQELNRMDSLWPKVSYEKNGYLGAWVATKALVGESSDAWKIMLTKYERNSEWPIGDCRSGAASLPRKREASCGLSRSAVKFADQKPLRGSEQLASTHTPPPDAPCMLPFCIGKRLIGALH